jgi:hypothetical protein
MKFNVKFNDQTGKLEYYNTVLRRTVELDCCQPAMNTYTVDCNPTCTRPPGGTNFGFSIETPDTIVAGDKIVVFNYPVQGVKTCFIAVAVNPHNGTDPLQSANKISACTPCF